jgi:hypothetical protein
MRNPDGISMDKIGPVVIFCLYIKQRLQFFGIHLTKLSE